MRLGTTAHLSPTGPMKGGQIGCDYGNVLTSDSINVLSGLVDIRQSVQAVTVGLTFHTWGGQ